MSKFFDELMESVQQMDEIVRGERRPSRDCQKFCVRA
jgi:putative transcriptional regulator